MTSSKSASPWISLRLGRALNFLDIRAPTCPKVNAPSHEKAHAFDATTQAISAHLTHFDFAELSACLTSHVPGQHTFVINQVEGIDPQLTKAPFLC